MKISISKTFVLTLALCITLALLLTACSNGGDTPTGDNSTPGTSSTPTERSDNSNTPDTSILTETPDISSTPDTSTPEVNKAAEYEAGGYNVEIKDAQDQTIIEYGNMWGVDIDKAINDTYEKYGDYLNENITKDSIRCAMLVGLGSPYFKPRGENPSGISPDALDKVNDYLADYGEDELDSKIPEQNIAALWLAASLYYDPDVDNGYPAYDIAMPFGLARADSNPDSAEHEAEMFWSAYTALFNLF